MTGCEASVFCLCSEGKGRSHWNKDSAVVGLKSRSHETWGVWLRGLQGDNTPRGQKKCRFLIIGCVCFSSLLNYCNDFLCVKFLTFSSKTFITHHTSNVAHVSDCLSHKQLQEVSSFLFFKIPFSYSTLFDKDSSQRSAYLNQSCSDLNWSFLKVADCVQLYFTTCSLSLSTCAKTLAIDSNILCTSLTVCGTPSVDMLVAAICNVSICRSQERSTLCGMTSWSRADATVSRKWPWKSCSRLSRYFSQDGNFL